MAISFTDAFTGRPAKQAAEQNAALYGRYGQQAGDILSNYGRQAGGLFAGFAPAVSDIYSGYGAQADRYLTDAAGEARRALATGTAGAEGQFAGAKEAAQGGINAFAPLSALGTKYGQGSTLYMDVLGINGPEGVARAKGAFATSPGYEFEVNEATDAAARNAARLGLAGSGNALDEIRNRAQQIGNREYGNYLTRLGGFVSPELSATSGAAAGVAGGYRNLADIYGAQAGLYPAAGAREAALLSELGQGRAGIARDVAGAQAGALGTSTAGQAGVLSDVAQGQTNVLGNVAGGQAAAQQQAAQAAQQGSQNFWNALLGLGGLGVRALSSAPQSRLAV